MINISFLSICSTINAIKINNLHTGCCKELHCPSSCQTIEQVMPVSTEVNEQLVLN